MQRSQIAPLIIGALAMIAIVLGLTVTGGPEAGRSEKRDKLRADDIARISRLYVPCLADEADRTLPDSLVEDEVCLGSFGAIRLVDPYSNLQYRYDRISNNRYRVCASFDRAELVAPYVFGGQEFDSATGCVTQSYNPSRAPG